MLPRMADGRTLERCQVYRTSKHLDWKLAKSAFVCDTHDCISFLLRCLLLRVFEHGRDGQLLFISFLWAIFLRNFCDNFTGASLGGVIVWFVSLYSDFFPRFYISFSFDLPELCLVRHH